MSRKTDKMTLFYRDGRGSASQKHYPLSLDVTSPETLQRVAQHDHVCASYKDGCRGADNFIYSDCLAMDCDNSPARGEDPDISSIQWVTPEDVKTAFPGVRFYAATSRNHMREKGGRPPRPKHHYYFPIDRVTVAGEYADMKVKVHILFTAFDGNALDAARFFFGAENTKVDYYDDEINMTQYLAEHSSQAVNTSLAPQREEQ